MQRAELDLTKFGITATCAEFVQTRDAAGSLIYSLRALFASEEQTPYRYEVPLDWWEHFRERWFPLWLLKRFPLKKRTVEVCVKTLYPFLKTQLPLNVAGPKVFVLVQEGLIGSFLPMAGGMTPKEYSLRVANRLFEKRFYDARKCPFCYRGWFE